MSSIEGGPQINHSETEFSETAQAWIGKESAILKGLEGQAATVAKIMSLTSEAAARDASKEQA